MKFYFCACIVAASLAIPGTARSQIGTGVISGTVVDERGAPVSRVIVHALGQTVVGGRQVDVSRSVPTDESGRFRIDRLPAQSFVVAVAPSFVSRSVPPGVVLTRPLPEQPMYAVTYFPGVIDRAQAQPIAVAEGAEQTIFIELSRVTPVHLRGTLSSPTGRSTSGVQLQLQRRIGNSGSSTLAGYVQADGSFDLAVPPGDFTVMASIPPGLAGTEFAVAEVHVGSTDLDGIALVLGSGGSIHGQIIFDGPSPGPAPLGATINVMPAPGTMILGRMTGPVPIAEDWTFQAKGQPMNPAEIA